MFFLAGLISHQKNLVVFSPSKQPENFVGIPSDEICPEICLGQDPPGIYSQRDVLGKHLRSLGILGGSLVIIFFF
jgi:hypothetical protein